MNSEHTWCIDQFRRVWRCHRGYEWAVPVQQSHFNLLRLQEGRQGWEARVSGGEAPGRPKSPQPGRQAASAVRRRSTSASKWGTPSRGSAPSTRYATITQWSGSSILFCKVVLSFYLGIEVAWIVIKILREGSVSKTACYPCRLRNGVRVILIWLTCFRDSFTFQGDEIISENFKRL